MKLKHSALLAVGLWLCVAMWIGAMILAKPRVQTRFEDEDASATLTQLQTNVEENRKVLSALGRLERLERQPPGDGEALLAVDPVMFEGVNAGAGSMPDPVAHQLSVILNVEGGRRALLDGQWIRAGSRLANGSRVRSIGRDRVLLETAAGNDVGVEMPEPFSQQAKIGARP